MTYNRESISIFYSWQSDTDQDINRNFIGDSIDCAIQELNQSNEIFEEIVLDCDTKNVPGIPQVSDALLEKINRCSIFIPDITYVAKTKKKGGKRKNIPNPNVLIEFGYALKSLGGDRIITVFNEAHGKCSDGLPFDISHRRWPIVYDLKSGSTPEEKNFQKKLLTNELKKAIKLIIEEGLKSAKPDSHARKIIAEIKEQLFFSKYSPIPLIEQLNRIYSQFEENAINGDLLDIETFLQFIKIKYLPEIRSYIHGKNVNYLDYWGKIFDGSIHKIKSTQNSNAANELLNSFIDEMWFSEFVPVQSATQYQDKLKMLSKKAISGEIEDIEKFKDYLINDFVPFMRAYDGSTNNDHYIAKWNEIFEDCGILSQIEKRYKYK